MNATLILGAGFSHIAGLPLTKDLFNTPDIPRAKSKDVVERFKQVQFAWSKWKQENSSGTAEEWLRLIYEKKLFASYGATWEDALDFAMARLVNLPPGKNAPYYHGITTSVQDETHRHFWPFIRERFEIKSVVTMNYDILAEQGLKKSYSKHRQAPLCFYGGFPYTQTVRMMKDVVTRKHEKVPLGHEVAIYKMHGSINWANEPHSFKIHDDVRAAFRSTREPGSVAIIPPMPEEEIPEWLTKVWEYAKSALADSYIWIVCGYSLPQYDIALKNLFKEAARKTRGLEIYILDPVSESLKSRWEALVPSETKIYALPGLPECLETRYWNV